jgi:urease accessory protein
MLHVFKPLAVVDEVRAPGTLSDEERAYRQDAVILGWEQRSRTRGRRRSDGGVEFGLALPRGTILNDGDCLVLPNLALIVRVVALEEPVFVIRPGSTAEWGLFAYHIGNSHQPLMIAADALVCAEVPGMEQVLTYHGIAFARERRVFAPIGYAADHRHRL